MGRGCGGGEGWGRVVSDLLIELVGVDWPRDDEVKKEKTEREGVYKLLASVCKRGIQ